MATPRAVVMWSRPNTGAIREFTIPPTAPAAAWGPHPIRAGIQEDAPHAAHSMLLTCQGTGNKVCIFLQGVCHGAAIWIAGFYLWL